jgi:hypothetical protein
MLVRMRDTILTLAIASTIIAITALVLTLRELRRLHRRLDAHATALAIITPPPHPTPAADLQLT